eukprot:TRINITY_DN2350_c0_g1_i1.p1 TRINITY_DN2350_c0_g1~~TRINITY_DN2350_c0_g1_i1.p1  ORF type:complete len:341 (+),score=79.42 TRINITY_DN2350_c0_g1_i1:1163-2185(+)
MTTPFIPIYPPEYGIFVHKFMPTDLDWTKQETKLWRWEPAAFAVLDRMPPDQPYKEPDWLQEGIKYASKEEVVEKCLQHDFYLKSAPKDVADALGPKTYLLPSYTNVNPIRIFRYRFAVDRFRSEPGTLDEIAKRWSLEIYHRTVREHRVEKVWYDQMNILQNRLKSFWHQNQNRDPVTDRCIWHDQAPGFQQLSWEFHLDKQITKGMKDVLKEMHEAEKRHLSIKRAEDLKRMDDERTAAAKRRVEEMESKRLEEIAKREEEKRLQDEKLAQEAKEREEKEQQLAKEREAHVVTATMTIQAKIAAYQVAIAQLTADLQAGKINGAEYGAQMAELSKMLQ